MSNAILQKTPYEYDDVDLLKYLRIIYKNKKMAMVIVFLTMVITIVTNFLLPKTYNVSTSFEIGSIPSEELEKGVQINEKIQNDIYGIIIRKNLNLKEKNFPKFDIDREENLITITSKTNKVLLTKLVLEEFNNIITNDHKKKTDLQQMLLEQTIKTAKEKIKITESNTISIQNKIKSIDDDVIRIQNKIKYIDEEKINLEEKIDALQQISLYQQDPGSQFALFSTKDLLAQKKQEGENLYLQINSLIRLKDDFKIEINSFKTGIENLLAEIDSSNMLIKKDVKPTKVIKDPYVSEKPAGPRLIFNTIIALMVGSFLAIIAVSIQNWRELNRQTVL